MKKYIIFGIIALFLFYGCERAYSPDRPELEDIAKGRDGLVIEFIENAPPDEILEGSLFQAGLKVWNKGITDVKNGYLLMGYEKEYIELYNWQEIGGNDRININLDGKSMVLPDGGENVFIANLEARDIGIQREKALTTIFATTCYDYKTEAYTNICVDTDPYKLKSTEKVCDAADVSLSDQGAPVAVTSIEYKLAVSKDLGIVTPQFTIHFKNAGTGTLLTQGKADAACSAQPLGKDDLNTLKVSAYLSEAQLTCKPEVIKLTENRDYTICTLEAGIDEKQQSYYALLSINAEYGYMDTISRTITILKSV